MKIFMKILVASSMLWAFSVTSGQAVSVHGQKVMDAYNRYQEQVADKNKKEEKKALKDLKKVCDKECPRSACKKDKTLQKTCIEHCPTDKIKNCSKGYESKKEINFDKNGIPKQKVASKHRKAKIEDEEEEEDLAEDED